jgi:mono/diheme cytochrome c family protein
MSRRNGSRIIAGALTAAAVCALACGDSSERPKPSASPSPSTTGSKPAPPPTEPEPAEMSQEELVARGRSVYLANCTACHNLDPRSQGAIGPDIAGSSLELIEGKVLRNEYPPGYTPKRDSRAMVPLPYVEKEIPALAAFLAAADSPQ